MSDREIYANAPVVLVAAEVRHPLVVPLSTSEINDLKRRLAPTFPLYVPATSITLVASPSGTSHEPRDYPRFMTRDRTSSVMFRDDAFVVETTRYSHHDRLRAQVELAAAARQAVAKVDGVERLGVRYINEIRVPDGESVASWSSWLDSSLVGPAGLEPSVGVAAKTWQGAVVFSAPDGVEALLRYSPLEGYAVNPSGDLKRETPPPGPCFLVDIDCSWAPTAEVPDLDVAFLASKLDDLNELATTLFERVLTEKLRDEVLRRAA